jgi:hypothetical protein
MWDTTIRAKLKSKLNLRNIGEGREADNYLAFLEQMRDIAYDLRLFNRIEAKACLAKQLDEYHYVELIMKKR